MSTELDGQGDSVWLVAPSFFSRGQKVPPNDGRDDGSVRPDGADPGSIDEGGEAVLVHDRVEQWRSDLQESTDAADARAAELRLDLRHAHPSGLAQLYAEHATKLSNLVREEAQLKDIAAQARALVTELARVRALHGSAPVHLAIGAARWIEDGQAVEVPALLRPLSITLERDGEVVLKVLPGIQAGPELSEALAAGGHPVDPEVLAGATRTARGFAPGRAVDLLRDAGAAAGLQHLSFQGELQVGQFVHPAHMLLEEYRDPAHLLQSDIVAALAGNAEAAERVRTELPEPRPEDRDPWEERGVGDQTPRMLDIVETAAEGHSFVLDVPAGADGTSALASILAEFGSRGRSVLHVTSSTTRTTVLQHRLEELGVTEMTARLDGDPSAAVEVRERLHQAMADTSAVGDPIEIEQMRTELRRIREALAAHITHLHRPFPTFGVSAFDALQVLTDLTNQQPGPTTRVRLPQPVLTDIARDQGARARQLLDRASHLGMFSGQRSGSAWEGIVINSSEQVPEIMRRLQRLTKETLPELRVRMMAAEAQTDVHEAINLAEWTQHLDMFEGVREGLDVFLPEVFEKSAADMIIATAPRQWRKEHGVEMPRSQRKRLVKQAEDLVRPGRHVEDLHAELIKVQERREKWRTQADADGWPKLPDNLSEAAAVTASVNEDLDFLAPYLQTAYPNTTLMPLADLSTLLERLEADPEGARILPQRVAVAKDLNAMGLGELAADLREREVPQPMLAHELDLAWWASVLQLMLQQEPRLGGFDSARLESMVADGRRLDREQVASLAPQAVQRLRHLRLQAMAARPEQHSQMIAAVQNGTDVSAIYGANSLAFHLVPVVLTTPIMVPALVPTGHSVDLLVLEDLGGVPLAELVPIIARARQVIVVGGAGSGAAVVDGANPLAELGAVLPSAELDVPAERLNEQVARLLTRFGADAAGVPVPFTDSATAVTSIVVNGTGMPAPGSAAIESSREEVAAVVEAVVAHALERPDESLAVVALNALHADRIRDEVAAKVAGSPGLASFFDPAAPEPFAVADPATVGGLHRDRIIIAVGFAKTPHGRIIHDFGALSTSDGANAMARVLRTVRGDLTVVSSIRAEEIDRARVNAEGSRMLIDLLDLAESGGDGGGGGWPTLEAVPDQLLIDLAERLYGLGLEVVPNLGVPGGMRIPLAIGHPEVPGRLLVALLTDDDAYVAEPSQRVRDRLLPEMLEAQGWKVRTELSMAVFIDPQRETEEIVRLVLDAVDEVNGIAPPPVQVPAQITDEDEDDVQVVTANEEDDVVRTLDGAPTSLDGEVPVVVVPAAAPADDADAPVVPRERGPRPPIARGLPLAAYADDQLDEMAAWVRSDGVERDEDQVVEAMREALGLTRRGAQSEAVLRNVVRRTQP